MPILKFHEKAIFEKLLNRGGYVLDFNEPRFSSFFAEYGIDINQAQYQANGTSKINRLRSFWDAEPAELVIKVLNGLLQYAEVSDKTLEQSDVDTAKKIILSYSIKNNPQTEATEEQFINAKFETLDIKKLNLDPNFEKIIRIRINEIQIGLQANTPLSVIFLCGSSLEGIILEFAIRNARIFNESNCSPKNKEGQVKPLHEWTLSALIDVSHDVGFIKLDVKKFSHSVKDFRNYIHPRQQVSQNFNPDIHTAKICWQVLQAAIADLCGARNQD